MSSNKSHIFKLVLIFCVISLTQCYSSLIISTTSTLVLSSILSTNSIRLTNSKYLNKNRFVRYENSNNCGKRKRNIENRKCFRFCSSDSDCRGSKRRCLCDGECGMSCVRITTSCTKIDEFKNGIVTYSPDNLFGSNLIYECDPSYTLIGNKVRLCEGDGWWSGTSPVCVKEMFCEYPPIIQNAIPNVQISNETSYKQGTEVEYQCDIGFTDQNKQNNRISCQDSGQWSDINLKCTKIECGKPEEIENGILRATDYTYSSVIEYKCNQGYRIRNGDYIRECDLDGKWTGRKPSCEPVNCSEPPVVKNAIAVYNQTVFKSHSTYKCTNDDYYISDDSAKIYCLSNGKWSDELPKCLEKNCSLDAKEYSKEFYTLISTTNQIGEHSYVFPIRTTLKILCQSDYELVGNKDIELTCNLDSLSGSRWSDIPPICKLKIYCPLPPISINGLLILKSNTKPTKYGFNINTTLQYSCAYGYKLIGSDKQQCSSEGEWIEAQQPTCIQLESTSTSINKLEQNCKIDSSSMLFSYNDLTTTQSQNEFFFLNATIGSFIEHGRTVSFFCKETELEHIYYAKCFNGTLVTQQNCNELITRSVNNTIGKSCPPPFKIPNGFNKFSSFLHGSKAIYQCLTGFELTKGDKELKCNDGVWVGVVATCTKVNCGFPGQINNGRILYIGTLAEYTYQPYMTTVGQNKQIRYECDKDFKLVGPSGSTCINGNWKPSVKIVQCLKDQSKVTLDPNVYTFPLKLKSKISSGNKLSGKTQANEVSYLDDDLNSSKARKLKRLKKHKQKQHNNTRQFNEIKRKKKFNHFSEHKLQLKKKNNNTLI